MLKYLFQYKFSIILAALISLVSLLPSSSLPDSSLFSFGPLDKLVHFSMYGSIGLTSLLESRCKPPCIRYHTILITCLLLMSAAIEVLQATVVPTRSAEWLDLLANFMGLAGGYIAYRILSKLRS